MLNELFATLSAAILGMMPVSTAPDVHITSMNVEKSIQQFAESNSKDTFTVHCNAGETITLKDGESRTLKCKVENKTLNTIHNTEATLKASNGSVAITGFVDSEQVELTPSSTPDGMIKE